MRCSSYCTASSYNISQLVEYLIEEGYEPKYFDDVVHVAKEVNSDKKIVDIFYFPFGCAAIWNATEAEEHIILAELEAVSLENIENYSSDLIYYKLDSSQEGTNIDEENNTIILSDDSVFVKLSISYALAQSVKLDILERAVAEIIEQTKPLKRELASRGYVSLSKREITRKIGMLFNERYSINLHSDILDTPEFFWRRPSYEPIYMKTAALQNIQVRQNILNHRLDMIHELYTLLSSELESRHSTRLEIIIIVLITIEVILGFIDHGVFDKMLRLLM